MAKAIKSFFGSVGDLLDSFFEFVEDVWKAVAVPVAEEIFSWFGIEDETAVNVQKVSIAVLGDEPENITKNAMTKTILDMSKNDAGFFKNYLYNFNKHKAELKNYYQLGKNEVYVNGLPNLRVQGGSLDFNAVQSALNQDLETQNTLIEVTAEFPSDDVWVQHQLQKPPYNYLPFSNTLTDIGVNSAYYTDWVLESSVFNPVNLEYDISISRIFEITNLRVSSSDVFVNFGSSVTLTVEINRPVPSSRSLSINFTYSGADLSEFSAPTTLVINEGETSGTIELFANATELKTLKINVSPNNEYSPGAFVFSNLVLEEEHSSFLVTLVPQNTVALCVGEILTNENQTVQVPVKLSGTVSSSFSVDWETIDVNSALPVEDYTESSGTVFFNGNQSEIVNISINIIGDALPESFETFEVSFSNSSLPEVLVSQNGVVKIIESPIQLPAANNQLVTKIINLPGFIKERHLVARYHKENETSDRWYYWLYNLNDNTYSGVNPNASSVTNLDMMPVAVLRKNKQFINQSISDNGNFTENFGKDTDLYKTTKSLLRRINLNVDDVIDTVGENPDINAIDDVFINFSMCPSDNNKILSKLLFLHWYEIVVEKEIVSDNNQYSATFEEGDVNNGVGWTNQRYINLPLDAFGENLDPGKLRDMKINEFYHKILRVEEEIIQKAINTNETRTIIEVSFDLHIFKKTSSDTVDWIKVSSLSSISAIAYQGYHNVVVSNLGDENFTLPVSWFILNKLQGKEIIEVFPYIFRIDIYAIDVVEIDWYKTKAFKGFFNFVMLVITFASLGTTTSLWAALGKLLVQYAIAALVVYIAELTGNAEAAAVVGIVATIYFGNATGADYGFATAEGLTNIVTAFATNLGNAQSGELKALQEDLNNLVGDFERQQEMLDDRAENGNRLSGLEYWAIKSVDTNIYESRDIQYNYDLLYDYDNIISNFYKNNLITANI